MIFSISSFIKRNLCFSFAAFPEANSLIIQFFTITCFFNFFYANLKLFMQPSRSCFLIIIEATLFEESP